MKGFVGIVRAEAAAALAVFVILSATRAEETRCTNICGEGNQITKPNGVILITDKFGQVRELGCQQSQDLVASGSAPDGWCSSLYESAIGPCACAKPDGTLLVDILQPPSKSPDVRPCNICGGNNVIGDSSAVVDFTDHQGMSRKLSCAALQALVKDTTAVPRSYCNQIVQQAQVPCRCSTLSGDLIQAPPSATSPIKRPSLPPHPKPTTALATPKPTTTVCPGRRKALDACLETVNNGISCVSCVTDNYWPDSSPGVVCNSIIGNATCRGLVECPCGTCGNKFIKYVKCLAPSCTFSCESGVVVLPAASSSTAAPKKKKPATAAPSSSYDGSGRSIFSAAAASAVPIPPGPRLFYYNVLSQSQFVTCVVTMVLLSSSISG